MEGLLGASKKKLTQENELPFPDAWEQGNL